MFFGGIVFFFGGGCGIIIGIDTNKGVVMKKVIVGLFVSLVALTGAGCTLSGGTALDKQASAAPGSAEHITFCQEREQKALAVNSVGFLFDVARASINTVSAPVMIAVEGAGGQALKNPTTQHLNDECAYVWEHKVGDDKGVDGASVFDNLSDKDDKQ